MQVYQLAQWLHMGNFGSSGWQICNGGSAATNALSTLLGQSNVPDLRDEFVIGAGNSYSRHNTGGYTDVFIPLYIHIVVLLVVVLTTTLMLTGVLLLIMVTDLERSNNDSLARNVNVGGDGSHSHSYSGTTAVNTGGAAITSAQRSVKLYPYCALIYIMKIYQILTWRHSIFQPVQSNGQIPTQQMVLTGIYNGNVWKKDATAGVKGRKGEGG